MGLLMCVNHNEFFQKTTVVDLALVAQIETIKEWMKSQSYLPEIMEDAKIRNFLFLNKFKLDQTKSKIDMYYTVRGLIPDLYDDCNPRLLNFKQLMDMTYFCIHPKTVKNKYKVFIMKVQESNRILLKEMVMQFCNITEIRLSEERMVGEIMVFDMVNVSLNYLRNLTPSLVAKALAIFEKVYSLRIKEAHLVNSPPHVSNLMTILKPLLKPKIFDRVKVYRNDDVMKQLFTKDVLPRDYGGGGPSLQELNEITKLKLAQYQRRFDELDKLRVNEKLRPHSP